MGGEGGAEGTFSRRRDARARAQAHVDAHVAVGLVDRLDASLRLFHALLPEWFGPSTSFCKCRKSGGGARWRPKHAELSRASLEELRRRNALDLELIDYVRARLERQLVACGVDTAEGAHAALPVLSRTAVAAGSAICVLAVVGFHLRKALRAEAQPRPRRTAIS